MFGSAISVLVSFSLIFFKIGRGLGPPNPPNAYPTLLGALISALYLFTRTFIDATAFGEQAEPALWRNAQQDMKHV